MAVPACLPNGEMALGTLGLINGILHSLGAKRIAARYDGNGFLLGFRTY
jgi:hypothetical protein